MNNLTKKNEALTEISAQPAFPPEIQMIALDQIAPSVFAVLAPRKDDISGLAESMKATGLLEPIMVTDQPHNDERPYEIILGHRRFLAAIQIAWPTIPCIVARMTDEEIIEAQCAENAQRLPDNIWQQAKYVDLLMTKGEGRPTLRIVAKRLGKSMQWVGRRFAVAKISDPVRKLIPKSYSDAHIELLAQFDDAATQEAILQAASTRGDSAQLFEIFKGVAESFMTKLANVPFSLENAFAETCSCVACPKRANNRPDLFKVSTQSITEDDRCLDAVCFVKKHMVHYETMRAEILKNFPNAEFAGSYSPHRPGWIKNEFHYYGASLKNKAAAGDLPIYFFSGDHAGKVMWITPAAQTTGRGAKKASASAALSENASPKQVIKAEIRDMRARVEDRRSAYALQLLIEQLVLMPAPSTNRLLALLAVFGTVGNRATSGDEKAWKDFSKFEHDKEKLSIMAWERIVSVLKVRLNCPSKTYLEGYLKEAKAVCKALDLQFESFINVATEKIKEPQALQKRVLALKSL